jgi:general secretion pathway protein K
MKASVSHSDAGQTASDGFIVVAVLWILGALSALVSIYAIYVVDSSVGFAAHENRLQAEAMVSAAIELTAYQQLALPPNSRSTHGQFNFRLGPATVAVEFQSEAGRIDLNAASKQLVAGLFAALGARPEDAEAYADRVIGWRTPAREDDNVEATAYRTARLDYGPRGGKFPHVNELSLVRGLPMTLVERALPFVTVHSGRSQVNVFDAAPEVIAALPGMNRERLNAFLAQRRASPDNGPALVSQLGPAQGFVTTEGSNTLRATVQVQFDNGRRSSSEVVFLVFEAGSQPFSILHWNDDLEGSIVKDGRGTARP